MLILRGIGIESFIVLGWEIVFEYIFFYFMWLIFLIYSYIMIIGFWNILNSFIKDMVF